MDRGNLTRRAFLARSIGGIGLGAAGLAGLARPGLAFGQAAPAGVTPNEDLSREHGVIVRLLLVFEEAARRLKAGSAVEPTVLASGLELMERFGHDYHEGLEEQFVFPRFDGTDLEGLCKVLFDQHVASRETSSRLQDLVKADLSGGRGREAATLMEATARMYWPHIGWEESVLFPAFRSRMAPEEYAGLEVQFAEQAKAALGPALGAAIGKTGFAGAVEAVAGLEKDLGIGDLSRYTAASAPAPKAKGKGKP
jgi:hemerythrin-like domain-containing protein